jgi:hypothetical protein
VSTKRFRRRLAKHFSGFCHQIKVRQQIGRKVSIYCTSCLPQNEERNFCIKQQIIRTLFKNLNKNVNFVKHIAVNVVS